MHDIMMNCLPILAITVMTVLGAAAAVRIIGGAGKGAVDHHGGHHGR